MAWLINSELIKELRAWFIDRNEVAIALIKPQRLTGSAATIPFATLPTDFSHLKIICSLRSDVVGENDGVLLRLNGDSGNNYDWQRLTGNNATASATAARAASSIQVGLCEGANSRASNFSPTEIMIYGYQRTDNEKWTQSYNAAFGDVSADGDLIIQQRGGRWRNTAAITSITLLPLNGVNFVSGSWAYLYGIR